MLKAQAGIVKFGLKIGAKFRVSGLGIEG